MSIVDAGQRATAIDPLASFCVSAPAGSGKTELLIQRYLRLLSRVERPEQVLAITFTRKAAAEMRERVVEALQAALCDEPCSSEHEQATRELALQALASDARGEWQLVRDISRLNIKTIDSFCGGLTRQMPVLSEFGGQASLLDDATELYAEAVQALFRQLDSEHPVAADLSALMLHFDNNWERLQSLLVSMLARRDQWRAYVGVHHSPEESEAYLLDSVETVVRGELRVLAMQFAPYTTEVLDLQHYAAKTLEVTAPATFPDAEPASVMAWQSIRDLLQTKGGTWRKTITVREGFPAGKGEAQQRKDQLKVLIADLAQIDGLESALAAVTYLPQIERGSDAWQLLIHLSRLLPLLAAQLLLVFQKHGAVDHSQVALSALQALGEDEAPTELALRLDYSIEHILVDEFQDTAINQYELLRCLTRGWGQHNAANPERPRTIMVVGDGMQSIYGFRGANVGLFLKARREGFNGVTLQPLDLLSNFRSDEGVVDWVNETFAWAFPPVDDINRGQVSYTPATPVHPVSLEPAVVMHAFHGDDAQAQEAGFICEQVALACADQDSGSIVVLGRSRGHLQPIIAGLKQRGISYSAQDLDSLADSPVVADLLTLCEALANFADRLAWLALLRAPWCGLELADLLHLCAYGDSPGDPPVWNLLGDPSVDAGLSTDGRRRLQPVRAVLQRAQQQRDRLGLRVWIEQVWLGLDGPACASQASALEDAETFFQLLEQAEYEGIGLDIDWLSRQLQKRYMSGGDPTSKVQLMTLHKAKGLEFDRVIIPQLAKTPRSDGRQLLLWDEHSGPDGERHFLLAADDHSEDGSPTLYNYLKQQRKEKSLLEGTRLLYVGATRAISHLMLTASLAWDEKKETFRPPPSSSLMHPIWPTFRQQMTVHEPGSAIPAVRQPANNVGLVRFSRPPAAVRLAEVRGASLAQYEGPNVPERPDNHMERSVGTVVHLAMEELSMRDELPASVSDGDLARWRQALQRENLWGDRLEQALAALACSVNCTLRSGEGPWVLSSKHPQARSEWALATAAPDGIARDIVIDRSFIDARTNVRWVIDYKNSQPEPGEALADFTDRESASYIAQLKRYRNAVRSLGNQPVRCALFFTALGHLHPLADLDLPAVEE